MALNDVKRSHEKDEVASGYQSRNYPTEETDDAPIDIAEAGAIRPPRGALQRFVRHYRILEFGSAVVLYLLALVFAEIEVHERPIPGIKVRLNATAVAWSLDPSINEVKLSEEVDGACHFPDAVTKNITGRFRPSFYDMCKWNHDVVWDGVTNLCTDAAGEKEGRKSFPSGHASFAWASMLVLALYLLGRSRLNCENRSNSTLRGGKKSLMLDILAGSVIGAVSALFAFNYNYGSIFSYDSAGCLSRRSMNVACRSEHFDIHPAWAHTFESRPPLLKHMSSEYIVDLSSRSMDSIDH
ncbi:Phosphatidic acid phosphatase type 2/haloperoxidase [Phytophthora cactorum]|nr:Phosphatidic acid phosphatase type 2/haloperoxidase [Phytophthora cactorum]